jgi:hypothetical protein
VKIAIKTKRDAGQRRSAEPKSDVESVHRGSLAEPATQHKWSLLYVGLRPSDAGAAACAGASRKEVS